MVKRQGRVDELESRTQPDVFPTGALQPVQALCSRGSSCVGLDKRMFADVGEKGMRRREVRW